MSALMCQPSTVKNLDFVASKFGDFLPTFQARHKREFGFANPGCDIINDGSRVGGIRLSGVEDHALVTSSGKPPCVEKFSCLGHNSKCMSCDHMIHGPLIIIDKNSRREAEAETYWQGIGRHPILYIFTQTGSLTPKSIYMTRFMSIGEQMGRILRRTAISLTLRNDLTSRALSLDSRMVSFSALPTSQST
ncbi:unnamed protein product [Clavelina lepadiformis]|uniref:Uncharacterized protein n=1 Tax=Clavelina lepadiformis TaxID=159417 RepID=A0ABP0FR09_CLALP